MGWQGPVLIENVNSYGLRNLTDYETFGPWVLLQIYLVKVLTQICCGPYTVWSGERFPGTYILLCHSRGPYLTEWCGTVLTQMWWPHGGKETDYATVSMPEAWVGLVMIQSLGHL